MQRFSLFILLCLVAAAAHAAPWNAQCIQTITIGQTINGQLSSTDCTFSFDGFDDSYVDVYAFSGVRGQQIAITMTSNTALVDSYLELHDSNERNSDPLRFADRVRPNGHGHPR